MENFIDYAVISNNQNPEYTNVFKWIQKRWNDLGIKTVYINCIEKSKSYLDGPVDLFAVDKFGNLSITVETPLKFNGDRWFSVMIYRFLVCTLPRFQDKVMVISDGDLLPINKKYILKPSYDLDVVEVLKCSKLVCTNMYPYGDSLATYTYGYGKTFNKILRNALNLINGFNSEFTQSPSIKLSNLLDANRIMSKLTGKYYVNDEMFMNILYKMETLRRNNYNLIVNDGHVKWSQGEYELPWSTITHDYYKYYGNSHVVVNPGNRKWLEMVQEMNNLYEFQIPLLTQPLDLAPFVEMHNFRDSTMSIEKWNKLFNLLEEFDKLDVTPNCWFWNSIPEPWRDTRVTKEGQIILGDEYD